jgi:hypothetical protein
VGGGALLEDTQPPDMDICGCADCLSTCVIEFYIERVVFIMICLPYVGIIMACILGRATISDSDGTDFSTRVYAIRCVWPPTAASYLIR